MTTSIAFSVVLMVIAGFAPAVLMGVLGWKSAVSVAMLGGLATFLACTMGRGWQTGLMISVPFSIATALAVWASPYPLAAAIVLAAAAFLRGHGAKVGLQNALLTTVIALGFLVAEPPTFEGAVPAPVMTGLIMLGTTLWATLIVFLAKRWVHPPKLEPIDTTRVLWISSVLAIMVGFATWFVVHFNLGHGGGWIILTIVVVYQPNIGDGLKKAGGRALGTILGFLIAIVVGIFVSSGPILYALGTACLIVALVVMLAGKPYWWFATFLTPAIVLYESAGSTVTKVAIERLDATIVGIAITLVMMLILGLLAKAFERRTGANEQPANHSGGAASP